MEAEPGGVRPQAKEGRQPLEARRGKEQLLPWNLQKEPALPTPGLQFCKSHLGLVPSVTVRGAGEPCGGCRGHRDVAQVTKERREEKPGWVGRKRGQRFLCLLALELMLPQQARSPLQGSGWNLSMCGFEDNDLPGMGKATRWGAD